MHKGAKSEVSKDVVSRHPPIIPAVYVSARPHFPDNVPRNSFPGVAHGPPEISPGQGIINRGNDSPAALVLRSDHFRPHLITLRNQIPPSFDHGGFVHVPRRSQPKSTPLLRRANPLPVYQMNVLCSIHLPPNEAAALFVNLIANVPREVSRLHYV